MLKRYIAHLERQGYTPASIRRFYAPVRALLATAYEDGLLSRPVNIRVVLEHAQATPRRPALTGDQTAALLAEIPAEHLDLALFFATTGARLSEPASLRWRDLTTDDDGYPIVTFPRSKTDAGLKPIRLTPGMAEVLTARRAGMPWATPDDLVFPSTIGTEMHARNWRRRVSSRPPSAPGSPGRRRTCCATASPPRWPPAAPRPTTSPGSCGTPTAAASRSRPTSTPAPPTSPSSTSTSPAATPTSPSNMPEQPHKTQRNPANRNLPVCGDFAPRQIPANRPN